MWLLAKKFWRCAQELAGLVELHHRMWPVAEDPYVVILVDVHSRDFAKVPSRRKLGPIFHDVIMQGRARSNLGAQERACGCEDPEAPHVGDRSIIARAFDAEDVAGFLDYTGENSPEANEPASCRL